MSTTPPPNAPAPVKSLEPEVAALRAVANAVQSRIIGGLLLVLPVAITFYILYFLYSVLQTYVIGPVAWLVAMAIRQFVSSEWLSRFAWIEVVLESAIAIAGILIILWILGLFVQSRLHRALDWVLLRVPLVTHIYKAVRNVLHSLGQANANQGTRRVVLVSFPHPGLRSPGFVTSQCIDRSTGRTILCVFVPMSPFPTSGFLVTVPESDVVDTDWDVDQTLQAIVSGGISTPSHIRYFAETP